MSRGSKAGGDGQRVAGIIATIVKADVELASAELKAPLDTPAAVLLNVYLTACRTCGYRAEWSLPPQRRCSRSWLRSTFTA